MVTDLALELAAAQLDDTPQIVVPLTGQVVNLREPFEVAAALEDVREVKRQLDELRALLEGVLRLEAQKQGTKTLHLGSLDAVVSGGEKSDYDSELLAELLRDAGLPEERISEAIVETVSYKVNQLVLRQLAAANPDYAAAIELSKSTVPVAWRVTVKGATR